MGIQTSTESSSHNEIMNNKNNNIYQSKVPLLKNLDKIGLS